MTPTAGNLARPAHASRTARWRSLVPAAGWFVAAFTGAALLYAAQWGMEISAQGGHADWGALLASSLLSWYSCGVASIPLIWLAWYYPLDFGRLLTGIPVYLLAIGACAVLRYAMFVPVHNAIYHSSMTVLGPLRSELIPECVTLASVVTVVMAIRYYRSARERDLRTAHLEREVTQARLEALQMQLHPHFLFNTLHCVSTLMHRDVDRADEMLVRLCDLLRITLERPERAEIPLSDELAILERYLDIMEMRFPNRMRVRVDVPAEARSQPVPALLLQPLLENVLRHGLDEERGCVEVAVTAHREGEALILRVTDDGRGLPSSASPRFGTGLENTRRRLDTLYPGRSSLRIEPARAGGTVVELTLPCRRPA